MQTAYLISGSDMVVITEIAYEKRTAKSYCGCKIVGHIIGKAYYLSERQDASFIVDTLSEALRRGDERLRLLLDRAKERTNSINSRLGELQKIARTLDAQGAQQNETATKA